MARLLVTAITIALLAVPLVGTSGVTAAPTCKGKVATIVGNNKANVIVGTPRRDVIVAKGGNDKIYGRGGGDFICAGGGRDLVKGGAGNDRIFGGTHKDILKGGSGFDRLDGGTAKDACYVQKDGGTKVNCEDGNLKVWIDAPASIESTDGDDPDFRFDVFVQNVGATSVHDVELTIGWGLVNVVTCTIGTPPNPKTYVYGTLLPGHFRTQFMTGDCAAPGSGGGQLVVTATGETSSTDPDLTNNVYEAVIPVTEP